MIPSQTLTIFLTSAWSKTSSRVDTPWSIPANTGEGSHWREGEGEEEGWEEEGSHWREGEGEEEGWEEEGSHWREGEGGMGGGGGGGRDGEKEKEKVHLVHAYICKKITQIHFGT